MFLSERIASIAPPHAVFFRLLAQRHDDSTQVYPLDPGSYFHIGESPYGIPSGNYTICFYTDQKQPMPHHNQPLRIDLQSEVHQANQAQLSLYRSASRAGERAAAGSGSAARPALNTPGAAPQAKSTAASPPPPSESAGLAKSESAQEDLEFRKYTYAMDLEDRQQEFIKNSAYVTEVGEVFALNRIMRRELMELQRIIVLNSQQAHKEVSQVKGTIHDLLEIQREVLTNAAQTTTRPPPPPPDYVGLGHSALATIRDLGVAILHRSHSRESESEPRQARPAQLPAATLSSSPSSEGPPTPAAAKPDIFDRMVSKLRATTDADIALAMSTPEQWKAMLDELRSGGTAPSTPEPARPVPPKPEAAPES